MKNVLIDPSNERKIVDFRKRGFRDVLVLGRYSYAHAHEPLREHTHGEMFEICYLDEGTQKYEVEGREYLLKGGDVFVTFPNEVHGSGLSPLGRGRFYWMLISVPSRRERFLNLPPGEGQELVGGLLNITCRHFKGETQLKQHLENIFRINDSENTVLTDADLKNHMLRFLLDILTQARKHANKCISKPVAAVMSYVDFHIFDEFPQVWQLAEVAGLSESRFKARFKQESGMSPGNFVTMMKMEKARELLADQDLSVTDIAFRLGFSSSQYFATVFKRFTAVRPHEWRKSCNT
jgi:AraC-like DNA-binding protein